MTWREVVYEYDGSFDGLLCCIYESYTQKELPAAFFRTKTKKRLALEAELLRTMEFYDEGRVVVVTLPLSLAERLSLTEADMDDVSALGGVVEGTDCSITMKETKDGAWKISVRTGARVNATKACAALGGGGHRAASGCVYHGSLADAKAAILAAVQAAVEE